MGGLSNIDNIQSESRLTCHQTKPNKTAPNNALITVPDGVGQFSLCTPVLATGCLALEVRSKVVPRLCSRFCKGRIPGRVWSQLHRIMELGSAFLRDRAVGGIGQAQTPRARAHCSFLPSFRATVQPNQTNQTNPSFCRRRRLYFYYFKMLLPFQTAGLNCRHGQGEREKES